MAALTMPERPHLAAAQAERRQFQRLLAVTTAALVPVVLAGRLLPPRWRPSGGSPPGRGSVRAEARAAAASVVPFAFMS